MKIVLLNLPDDLANVIYRLSYKKADQKGS